MSIDAKQLAERFATAKILVVDDEHYMRKVVRTMRTKPGPSIPGIYQSRMTTSGAWLRISSRPAGPSGAS